MPKPPAQATLELIEWLSRVEEIHKTFFEYLLDVRRSLTQKSNEEGVDIAFLCREMGKLFDDLRKECEKTRTLTERVVCYKHLQLQQIKDIPERIEGNLATATTSFKVVPTLPKESTDPENYEKLMEYIGVNNPLVTPKWKAVAERLTRLMEAGKPMPKGILKIAPTYGLNLRRKNRGQEKEEE